MKKEDFYETCKQVDSNDCEKIIDKINEITCENSLHDEQKLFAIHIILSKNTNDYISHLKNELYEAKLELNDARKKVRNLEIKYREHLEHSEKEIETLNHIIIDALHIQRKKIEKQPVKKRFVVKIKKN